MTRKIAGVLSLAPFAAILAFIVWDGLAGAQTAAPAQFVKQQYFTNTGTMAASYKLCSYLAGTTTPSATYTTSAGNIANSNPIILDSYGRANVWLAQRAYKLELRAPGTDGAGTCPGGSGAGTITWTVDSIPGGSIGSGSNNYVPRFNGTGPYLANSSIQDDGNSTTVAGITFGTPPFTQAAHFMYLDGAEGSSGVIKIYNGTTLVTPARVGHEIGFLSTDFATTSNTRSTLITLKPQDGTVHGITGLVISTAQTDGVSCQIQDGGPTVFGLFVETSATTGSTVAVNYTTSGLFTQAGAGTYISRITGTVKPGFLGDTLTLKCGNITGGGTTLTIKAGTILETW